MSEEENSNENNEEEKEEDEGEGEGEGGGEENENEENEGGGEEGEEKDDDEEGEENEGEEKENEDEEKEDEEDNEQKKEQEVIIETEMPENGGEMNIKKFPESKLSPTKEIKLDLNLNLNNSSNIFFNGNEITMLNIFPKKSTLQLLMEISSEMDALSSHLDKVLPSPMKYNVDYPITNSIINIPSYSTPLVNSFDKEDIEIKNLINKANEISNVNNNSIYKKNNDININNSLNKEIKIFEDKGCQSADEYEFENSYNKRQKENNKFHPEYHNYNNNFINGSFPYDPYKHLDYYYELRNNNNNGYNFDGRIKRVDGFSNENGNFRPQPVVYSQPESGNNSMRNMNFQKFNNENSYREMPFQRNNPSSIPQAMDILLDKK